MGLRLKLRGKLDALASDVPWVQERLAKEIKAKLPEAAGAVHVPRWVDNDPKVRVQLNSLDGFEGDSPICKAKAATKEIREGFTRATSKKRQFTLELGPEPLAQIETYLRALVKKSEAASGAKVHELTLASRNSAIEVSLCFACGTSREQAKALTNLMEPFGSDLGSMRWNITFLEKEASALAEELEKSNALGIRAKHWDDYPVFRLQVPSSEEKGDVQYKEIYPTEVVEILSLGREVEAARFRARKVQIRPDDEPTIEKEAERDQTTLSSVADFMRWCQTDTKGDAAVESSTVHAAPGGHHGD